jgi:AraC-like DNA-binding protein
VDVVQLVYAVRGVLTVHTPDGAWVVPPHRAAWVPAGIRHRLALSGPVTLRTLYFAGPTALPADCRVLDVPPLVRELILHAVREAPLWRTDPAHRRLIGFLADRLVTLPDVPLQLPAPRDPRAAAAATALQNEPADASPVADLARRVGTSRRSLERAFLADTGMTVGQWRRRLRMLEALRLLAGGMDRHRRRPAGRLRHAQCVRSGLPRGARRHPGPLVRPVGEPAGQRDAVG